MGTLFLGKADIKTYADDSRSFTSPYWGDLNGDFIVDNTDVLSANKIRLGNIEPTQEQRCFMDVNLNGIVTGSVEGLDNENSDLNLINAYRISNIDSLPAESLAVYEFIPPAKTAYAVGESLNTAGMKVLIKNRYDASVQYELTENISINGYNPSKSGKQNLTASYRGMTFNFDVTVDAGKPTAGISSTNNISSTQTATLVMFDMVGLDGYYWGTEPVYSNNPYTNITGSPTSKSVEITISSNETDKTFYLTAKDTAGYLSSTATVKFFNTVFNSNGGSILTSNVITMDGYGFILPESVKDGYIFKNWNTKPNGSGTSYSSGDFYKPVAGCTLYAQWEEITLSAIAIKTLPSKTSYYVGDTLNTAGLTLTATYNDGSKKTISSNFECNPGTLQIEGTQTITVNYDGKSTTFTVTVSPVPVSSHTIYFMVDGKEYSKATYKEGEAIKQPTEPQKQGYVFREWAPSVPSTMPLQDVTVSAVFDALKFNAVFIADGVTVGSVTYTIENTSINEPPVPEKPGYSGKWSDYTLDVGGVTVNAVYTKITEEHKHSDKNNDGKCDDCNEITDPAKYDNYIVSNATVNVGQSKKVDFRSKVTVIATASRIPEGYYLAVFDGSKLCAKGDNRSVSYFAGEMRADTLFTIKIVDANGNPKGNNFQKNVKISVKTGFFDKLIAFFRGLFDLLPEVEIKP